jgi:anion-transporting  ArsA/GET3 family ATPase
MAVGMLHEKKIIFVTGKGGVGKSVLAASIALKVAEQKENVLLVELGDQSFYEPFFGLENVNANPTPLNSNLAVALWDVESCLREYVLYYVKVERLYKLFFDNKVTRSLVNAAPGLKELAILGKITSGERHVGPPFHYDTVVVDTFATGHALALFRAPKGMSETISRGPMGYHSSQIHNVLIDRNLVEYVIVTLADELPTTETLELNSILKNEFGANPSLIFNRLLDPPLSEDELKILRQKHHGDRSIGDFIDFLLYRMERQEVQIRRTAGESDRIMKVPLVTDVSGGIALAQKIAGMMK